MTPRLQEIRERLARINKMAIEFGLQPESDLDWLLALVDSLEREVAAYRVLAELRTYPQGSAYNGETDEQIQARINAIAAERGKL